LCLPTRFGAEMMKKLSLRINSRKLHLVGWTLEIKNKKFKELFKKAISINIYKYRDF